MLLDPHGDGGSRKPNVCLTDNEPLAEYSRRFRLLLQRVQGRDRLSNMQIKPGWDFMPGGTEPAHRIV
jgi:hypothetical protein